MVSECFNSHFHLIVSFSSKPNSPNQA